MFDVSACEVPESSLLTQFGGPEDYRDCFCREVAGEVTLEQYIERFYCSMAFRPERIVLGLMGRGASNEDARKLARGERGRAIAGLGGVRDRSCLALTAGRMKTDSIFRDAAHHFLRQFDKTFIEFEADASDADIAALAETRTARAFMLLGRVTGTFD